jgi:hypothetical protein
MDLQPCLEDHGVEMTTIVGFATHGETLKLIYEAFGVLPRKEARFDDFDEKDKKTLQKQLTRLASEEGNLVENYKNAITAFRQLLTKYLPVQGHAEALGMVLEELDLIYAEMIRVEGTYLDKLNSLRYFISIKAVPALVLALNRSMLLSGSRAVVGLWSEDSFWYLPTWGPSGHTIMPLAKVMRWAYAKCGMSQKQFHCPGKLSDPTPPAQQQNLDNAINWTRGKTLPSLPALVANFKESFTAQGDHNRPVDLEVQKSILTALVYARVATFAAKEIQNTYSQTYLEDVCSQIRKLTRFLQEEVQEFMEQVVPIIERQPSAKKAQKVWIDACLHHEHFVREKLSQVEVKLHELLKDRPGQPFRPEVLAALASKFGNFAVHSNIDTLQRQAAFKAPMGFRELLDIGFQIKQESTATLEQIDEFERVLVKRGLQDALCWLPPWLRGVYHYRRDDYATAFQHYETAFELAKYRAGSFQYKLVNQFVELAAKNDKAVSFKKGVDWASYIGLEIRWLREKEPTPENLDFVRYVMKKANYAHQL